MGIDTSSIASSNALPLGCDGAVHIKVEPCNVTPAKEGASLQAQDTAMGSPRDAAVTGLESSQGCTERIKFGIPEWGSPLPGMAPAPPPMPASDLYLDRVPTRNANVHVRAPAMISPVRPVTPVDHGIEKAHAQPSTTPEGPLEPVANAIDQQADEGPPAASQAEDPPHPVPKTLPQPPAESTANTKADAARAAAKSVPEPGLEQPDALSADLSGRPVAAQPLTETAAGAPTQPDAEGPAQQPAQSPDQAPAAPSAAPAPLPSDKVAKQQKRKSRAEALAKPQRPSVSQTTRKAQSETAALDELHAYVMSSGGTLGEGWTVHFQKRGSGHAKPIYLAPTGFTSVDDAEQKSSFTEKHLVARALGLMPPGSRSLRRLDPKGTRNAAADREPEADLGPDLDSESSDSRDGSEDLDNGADRLEVEDQDGPESAAVGDAAAADNAAAAEELQKLREYVKDCGGALPQGWSVRRIRCFGDRHRPLYVAPEDFLAVNGQPSKPTYSSKAQAGAGEAAVPRSKKQRTLHAISAAAADEAPVVNIPSADPPEPAAPPSQHAAIGWHVRVRAQHDRRRVTNAVVRDYDPPTGQYQLRLEGGGEEWRHLTDNIRWISTSPLEDSSATSSPKEATADDSEQAESDGSEPIPAPPVRQKKAAKRASPAAEETDLALMEAPARAGTALAAGTSPAAAGRAPYQGAWNKFKTGIPEKDTEILYECMAEIGVHLAPGWTSSYSTTIRRGKPEKDICYVPPQGFKARNGVEGRMYWSRPDVARAHGASSWPQRCAPRCSLMASKAAAATPEGAAASLQEQDSGELEEQKEWLQDFLNEEFEKAGWGDGSIAWQDVAKRKSDLSNNDIFQKVKALNKRAEERFPMLKDVCGKDGTAVIKKKIMMLFINATKRARKRLQNGIEDPPRSIVPAASQRAAPGPAAKALAPAPAARRALEKPPEQPHVQFPDDSPCLGQGAETSSSPPHCTDSYRPYQTEHRSTPCNRTSPSLRPLENALMRMPDMSLEVADKQLEGQSGPSGRGGIEEQGKTRTVAEHFFFFLKQPGATPEFLQELHRLAQNAM